MNNIMNRLYMRKASCLGVNYQLKKLLFTSMPKNVTMNLNKPDQAELNNNKSELAKEIAMKIKMSGPMSVANYMKHVLIHPTKGYYVKKDVFGCDGDFITSPEVSQLFGEMIAVWIISECKKIHNEHIQLVELGPGRGTFSRDILRVFKMLNMSSRISLHLVEVSPVLSEIQQQVLSTSEQKQNDEQNSVRKYYKKGVTEDNVDVYWYKSVVDIPQGFSIFIAQEFFDALPIHKFQKTKDGWFEVLVDVDPMSKSEDKFRFVLSKTGTCSTFINKNEKRDHVEISFDSMNIMRYISTAITENGGFILIIDYGHNGDKGDTFRAFRQHKQCDPLLEPGTADLTADVDFECLKRVAMQQNQLICFGPVNQQDFLMQLGINYRLTKLCKEATPNQRKQLEFGYKKIMNAEEMGTCFKVLSMFPEVLKEHFKKFPVHGFLNYTPAK